MENKYIRRSHLTEAKFRQLVKCFSLDLTATQTAAITSLNRKTVDRLYFEIRARISKYNRDTSPIDEPEIGEYEVDESYFGAKRVRGKRGRGAGSKTIVFGLFKRDGKVYTEIVPDCSAKTLQRIIRGRANVESVIHSDGWRGYDGLVDIGYEKHFRVEHGKDEFSKGNGRHINGIESFWSYAKNRLYKFHGIPKHLFYLHLKETEFRFNHRDKDLYTIFLKWFRECPL